MMNKMAPTVSSLQLVAAAAAAAAVCLIAKLAIADCWNELLLVAELLTLAARSAANMNCWMSLRLLSS